MSLRFIIAAWVKEARTSAGLSGAALGERLSLELGVARGHTRANISHWENGKHEPSIDQLIAISKVTQRSLPVEFIKALGGPVAPPRTAEVDEITAIFTVLSAASQERILYFARDLQMEAEPPTPGVARRRPARVTPIRKLLK